MVHLHLKRALSTTWKSTEGEGVRMNCVVYARLYFQEYHEWNVCEHTKVSGRELHHTLACGDKE